MNACKYYVTQLQWQCPQPLSHPMGEGGCRTGEGNGCRRGGIRTQVSASICASCGKRLWTTDHWLLISHLRPPTTDHTLSLIPARLRRCASGEVLSPRVLVTGILTYTCLRFLSNSHFVRLVGRVTPCAPVPSRLRASGAHGVTRPTVRTIPIMRLPRILYAHCAHEPGWGRLVPSRNEGYARHGDEPSPPRFMGRIAAFKPSFLAFMTPSHAALPIVHPSSHSYGKHTCKTPAQGAIARKG
jgi:hypothetical protein